MVHIMGGFATCGLFYTHYLAEELAMTLLMHFLLFVAMCSDRDIVSIQER